MLKRLILPLAAALLLTPSLATAMEVAEVEVGRPIPSNFAARDAAGKVRNYASIRGKKGTVLVFFRSAKWCPFCQAQLKDLKKAQASLAARGYTLAAISYDPPEVLAGFAKSQGIGYTLLSDAGSRMIGAFGLIDPQYAPGSFAAGVPRPTILVIDAQGKLTKKMVSADYKVRPTNAQILAATGAR
jgi:peroxiredoxin